MGTQSGTTRGGLSALALHPLDQRMQAARHLKLTKVPGIAETLDWAVSLMALHQDHLETEAVSLYVTNSVAPHAVAAFQQTIERLLTEEIDTLYMEQLMHNAESDSADGSSMGYLTMLHDYGVALAWKFAPSPQDPDVVTVTTMARLAV